MKAYGNIVNKLSIYQLDKIASDPAAAKKMTAAIYKEEVKMNAAQEAKNKTKGDDAPLLR